MGRESDRLLGELKKAVRVEMMHEFMMPSGGKPPTVLLACKVIDQAERGAWIDLAAESYTSVRPYRLVVDTAEPERWEVSAVRMGITSVLLNVDGLPASAFPRLPHWVEEPPVLAAELLAALRDVPIENIIPITIGPGLRGVVQLRDRAYLGASTPLQQREIPHVYFLAHVLSGETGRAA